MNVVMIKDLTNLLPCYYFMNPKFPVNNWQHFFRAMIIVLLSVSLKANDSRPNILWIIAEDMSPDLGCYGNQVVTTRNIDGLAEKGPYLN